MTIRRCKDCGNEHNCKGSSPAKRNMSRFMNGGPTYAMRAPTHYFGDDSKKMLLSYMTRGNMTPKKNLVPDKMNIIVNKPPKPESVPPEPLPVEEKAEKIDIPQHIQSLPEPISNELEVQEEKKDPAMIDPSEMETEMMREFQREPSKYVGTYAKLEEDKIEDDTLKEEEPFKQEINEADSIQRTNGNGEKKKKRKYNDYSSMKFPD